MKKYTLTVLGTIDVRIELEVEAESEAQAVQEAYEQAERALVSFDRNSDWMQDGDVTVDDVIDVDLIEVGLAEEEGEDVE